MKFNNLILERKIREFLEEDCHFSDISSSIIPKNAISSAKIITKSSGYISGLEELKMIYNILNVTVNLVKEDGDHVKKGDILAHLKGKTQSILLGERTALNLLSHMSAITNTTRKYVEIIRDSGKSVKIACTRKTLPGLRIFEKKAVILGGGETHRFSLDDMVLLKDTHLKYFNGNIEEMMIEIKKNTSFTKKIEIEIERVEDVLIAAKFGADIIMLDNMNPDQVEDAISTLKKNKVRGFVLVEVSGGITLDNIVDYVIAEPDIISSSELTQFPSEKVDISLRFD
ncbi:MAG: carboxylating nicotinate-nucleotide diphosphorylase [Candidatus Lokiarchaeota archaeon]|nr:carboxylating nicotinate-nucleotide diphosphorylase [Candidatus Lokiarchaeota archaeon]